jgi:hypothetical protein
VSTIGLVARPEKSPLLQHLHVDAAVTMSAEQRDLIGKWLTLEAQAHGR